MEAPAADGILAALSTAKKQSLLQWPRAFLCLKFMDKEWSEELIPVSGKSAAVCSGMRCLQCLEVAPICACSAAPKDRATLALSFPLLGTKGQRAPPEMSEALQ